MIVARMNVCSNRSTSPGNSFLGTAGSCIPTNRLSRSSAGTPGCLRIGIGQSVASFSLPERSKTHDSQMLLTFSNLRLWKDSNPQSGLGSCRNPKADDLMEASAIFISRILRLMRCAGTSHFSRCGLPSAVQCVLYGSPEGSQLIFSNP